MGLYGFSSAVSLFSASSDRLKCLLALVQDLPWQSLGLDGDASDGPDRLVGLLGGRELSIVFEPNSGMPNDAPLAARPATDPDDDGSAPDAETLADRWAAGCAGSWILAIGGRAGGGTVGVPAGYDLHFFESESALLRFLEDLSGDSAVGQATEEQAPGR